MRAVRKTDAEIPKKDTSKKSEKVKYHRATEKAPYRQARRAASPQCVAEAAGKSAKTGKARPVSSGRTALEKPLSTPPIRPVSAESRSPRRPSGQFQPILSRLSERLSHGERVSVQTSVPSEEPEPLRGVPFPHPGRLSRPPAPGATGRILPQAGRRQE